MSATDVKVDVPSEPAEMGPDDPAVADAGPSDAGENVPRESGAVIWATPTDAWIEGLALDPIGNIVAVGSAFPSGADSEIFLGRYSQQGAELFTRTFGGPGSQDAYDLDVTSDGTVILTGSFAENADFGGETKTAVAGFDLFAAAYSPDGQLKRILTFGADGNDIGNGIMVDGPSGDWLVTGQASKALTLGGTTVLGDHLFRVSPQGEVRWARDSGGFSIAGFNGSDAIIAGGWIDGQQLSHHSRADGTPSWSVGMDSGGILSVATSGSGLLFVGGVFLSNVTFGNTVIPHRAGGDVLLAAVSAQTGQVLWAHPVVAGAGIDHVSEVCLGKNGAVYVGGRYSEEQSGATDQAFLAKYGPDGNRAWLKFLASGLGATVFSVLCDSADGIVTGLSSGVLMKLVP